MLMYTLKNPSLCDEWMECMKKNDKQVNYISDILTQFLLLQ